MTDGDLRTPLQRYAPYRLRIDGARDKSAPQRKKTLKIRAKERLFVDCKISTLPEKVVLIGYDGRLSCVMCLPLTPSRDAHDQFCPGHASYLCAVGGICLAVHQAELCPEPPQYRQR
jgi:hypothetical protein